MDHQEAVHKKMAKKKTALETIIYLAAEDRTAKEVLAYSAPMRSAIASIEPDAKWGATFIEIRKKGLAEMNETPEERERLDKYYQKFLDDIVAAHYPEKLNKMGVYLQTAEECDCHSDHIRRLIRKGRLKFPG